MSYKLPITTNSDYNNGLNRLFSYRQQLSHELCLNPDIQHYLKFYDNFGKALHQAKLQCIPSIPIASECHGELNEFFTKMRSLLDQLLWNERMLKIHKIFRDTSEAVKLVDLIYVELKFKAFENMTTGKKIGHVNDLREAYFRIINWFNIFLRANIDSHSALYRYYLQISEKWKHKLILLVEDLFVWSFESIKWPIAVTSESIGYRLAEIDPKNVQLFSDLFVFILDLETGFASQLGKDNHIKELNLFKSKTEDFYVPIQLMATPLVKRFHYHFASPASKLNQLDNPEWYFCQVEQWITRNLSFLGCIVDPILVKYFGECNSASIKAKHQFVGHLVVLVRDKLTNDIPLLTEDRVFSHTLDEIIIFSKQIDFIAPGLFQTNPELSPLVNFLKLPCNFNRFLQLERSRMNLYVDEIFHCRTSWNIIFDDDFADDRLIVCEAADKFSLLLNNLLERCTLLGTNQNRICIIDQLLEQFDDFRLRLSQLINIYDQRWPFTQQFYSVLNTFHYLKVLLQEWQQQQRTLIDALHEANRDFQAFANLAKTFEHMVEQVLERIQYSIISDLAVDMLEYQKLNWHAMTTVPKQQMCLTNSGASLIYNLSVKINFVQKFISSDLFCTLLHGLALKTQDLFYDRLIMSKRCYFNPEGVCQLQFDVKYGLLSIFQFHQSPTKQNMLECTFAKLNDALLALNLNEDSVAYLKDLYSRSSGSNDNKQIEFKMALRNIGIYSLKPGTVLQIVDKRISARYDYNI